MIDLLVRRARPKKTDPPVKRRPRGRKREAQRSAYGELAVVLASWEPLHQVAAELPHWQPGDRGRPPDLPPVAHLLFCILYIACGCSDRQAEAELRYAPTWNKVRRILARRYPVYRGLRPGAQSPSRREFWRFREDHAITDDMLEAMETQLLMNAATQAVSQGQCTGIGGSITNPALHNTLSGDGTVLKPRYRGTPKQRHLNRKTGELEPVKYDADATFHEVGDDDHLVYGLKAGMLGTYSEHPNESIILDVFMIPKIAGRDEAAQGVEKITAALALMPGVQAASWDMAMRGVHLDAIRALGLVDIVKVPKTAAQAGKRIPPPRDEHGKRRTGHVFHLADGTTTLEQLHTYDGHPFFDTIIDGKKARMPLRKTRTRRVPQRGGGYRWYNDYTTPDDPRTPSKLLGATVTVRLDRCDDDTTMKYNRAEHLRPITIHDPPIAPITTLDHESHFDQCYGTRPGAEAKNSWVKHYFNWKRAPAVGNGRVHFMLICAALLNNINSALAYAERCRQRAAA